MKKTTRIVALILLLSMLMASLSACTFKEGFDKFSDACDRFLTFKEETEEKVGEALLDAVLIAGEKGMEYLNLNPIYFSFLLYQRTEDKSGYVVANFIGNAIDVVIPQKHFRKPVVGIGDYVFFDCDAVQSVTIPYGVKSIGAYAFDNCDALTTVTIPDSVTSIGNFAFNACTSLSSITIPESVTSIGNYAFFDCTSLSSVTIPASVTSIGDSAFSYCDSLASIEVSPDNPYYQSIDGNLYSKDGKTLIKYAPGKTATRFEIPASVESISEDAFYNCDELTEVTIPERVTSIGKNAFCGCDALTIYCEVINQPSGWAGTMLQGGSVIADYWAGNCPVVWNCNFNITASDHKVYVMLDGIRYVLDGSFATVVRQSSKITTANIPEEVTYGGQIYSVIRIDYKAFSGCTALTSITLLDSLTSIGDYAFEDCTSLSSITLPDSLTSIGDYAFENCTSLSSITIPKSVKYIGWEVFYDCDALTIYCEAESQPSGWDEDWNYSKRPVVWGQAQ